MKDELVGVFFAIITSGLYRCCPGEVLPGRLESFWQPLQILQVAHSCLPAHEVALLVPV